MKRKLSKENKLFLQSDKLSEVFFKKNANLQFDMKSSDTNDLYYRLCLSAPLNIKQKNVDHLFIPSESFIFQQMSIRASRRFHTPIFPLFVNSSKRLKHLSFSYYLWLKSSLNFNTSFVESYKCASILEILLYHLLNGRSCELQTK